METIRETELIPQFKRHMSIYGIETTRRRMVPDWRDGLKDAIIGKTQTPNTNNTQTNNPFIKQNIEML